MSVYCRKQPRAAASEYQNIGLNFLKHYVLNGGFHIEALDRKSTPQTIENAATTDIQRV